MKKILIVPIIFGILFVTSCTTQNINRTDSALPGKETKDSLTTDPQIQDGLKDFETEADLDLLLEDFTLPAEASVDFAAETDGRGFPLELVNRLKKAVCDGDADTLISELNDDSLMITTDDFQFEPDNSEEAGLSEKDLNEAIQNGAPGFLIYKCDVNGDQADEIIMMENLKYEYSGSNTAYLLKKSGDKYVFKSYDFLGYYRCFSIFQYGGEFYLIANYDDYQTRTTKAIGLFRLSAEPGFMWLINNEHLYIRKANDGYRYHQLYQNEKAADIEDIKAYIDDIRIDLIFTDRNHKTFYGDEAENYDLLQKARDNNPKTIFWNMYEVDVDNDGQKEYFDKKILYQGLKSESEVSWYDPESQSIYPPPFKTWTPSQYYLTQMWFKVINGKTVTCSLYRKNSEDIYLLDVRMAEDGKTEQLLDYVISLEANAEVADYWEYSDTNWQHVDYEDPDMEKAFPEDLYEQSERLSRKIQGDFVAVEYEDEEIPGQLIEMMERALFHGNLLDPDLSSVSFEISVDEFNEILGSEGDRDYDRYIQHIYRYSLDHNNYYLTVADTGGSARFVDITLYKEIEGNISPLDGFISLDFNARVIEYNNELYLLESSYNYYSKYTDTIMIMKLVPEGVGHYVRISLEPEKFEWEKIYGNGMPYEKAVSGYVSGIQKDLMKKSPINDEIEVYQGDETSDISHDRKLRLKSVGGDYVYYSIDFNNDGETEYFTKRFWFPSNYTRLCLINNFYRFTDKRIMEIDHDSYNGGNRLLIQLWFKEIEGKIYTFRLFLGNKDQYYLNVSLVEGTDITQVQTYIVVPRTDFHIDSGIRTS